MPHTPNILFFDLEVHPKSHKILEYGAVLNEQQYRGKQAKAFEQFGQEAATICGHNIIAHDLPILKEQGFSTSFFQKTTIDTLYLSALLSPKKPYHPLVKDYQLDTEEINNPLADAKLAKELLWDLLERYQQLDTEQKTVYYNLLKSVPGFDGFFKYVAKTDLVDLSHPGDLAAYILEHFSGLFCNAVKLADLIRERPVELAFTLAIIAVDDSESLLPVWVRHQFPHTLEVLNDMRTACPGNKGCPYCDALSPTKGLKRFFDFDGFRSFDGDTGKPLQEQVVEAALANKSFLAIFPTGGGKSLTFQLPALMKGAANRSLTVVISPLQSLMKDQVDVLANRHGITAAATINGMLSPLERGEAIRRVEEGGANLLYISPESLRSRTIMRLLNRRVIDRFVIDEAHCFSSWGQDFRVDYLYIGKFLKKLQTIKELSRPIPVSCFTATAKPAVIDDIRDYFQEELGLELQLHQTNARRKNLHYFVIKVKGKEAKYEKLRELLESEEGVKIVYVSRVKRSEDLAENLRRDGIRAKAYHGKLERDEKIEIQNEFMAAENELDVIVATSAFGMGVDKDNVQMVVHYNISDSLENYMQESGRAGRSADLQAKCYILFDETDLDAHFQLLNLSKLSHNEVYQIWQSIKTFRSRQFSKSALEIAKQAGWDTEMFELETRVKVAIAALEKSGYVEREENEAKVFAQSILVENVEEARRIMDSGIHHFIGAQQYENAQRIFGSLMSRAKAKEDTRVDHIAESLGIDRNEVTSVINVFKEMKILSNEKDLSAYYFTVQGKRNSMNTFKQVASIEQEMFQLIFPRPQVHKKNIYIREINEAINESEIDCNPVVIHDILNYWARVNYIRKERIDRPNDQYRLVLNIKHEQFEKNLKDRLRIAAFCLAVFQQQYLPKAREEEDFTDKKLLEFSVLDLKNKTESFTSDQQPIQFYEYILLYFHHLKILELKDGLMVFYNPMKITRTNDNNRKQYTKEDYTALEQYYKSKTEQIHIVGEYAKKQLENNIAATQFVDDYFSLPYEGFLERYFRNRKGKIRQPITEEKFRKIFSDLTAEQLAVVQDNKNDNILVAAGPGSGKTLVLVHKVASLLLIEDIKPEEFLMLTFSRPAALEFKTRLKNLVGNTAYYIDIFTYHGFAFQLAGRVGDLERSQNILVKVKEAIEQEEIPLDRLKSKRVIVVDEYQDVSREEYDFMMAIVNKAENIRVIVVGDDDQNIYEFRGSSIQYMRGFIHDRNAVTYYLTKNYRSKSNLLDFSNRYLQTYFSGKRIKHDIPLIAHDQRNGTIEIIRYTSTSLILPLIEHLKQKQPKGTTAVLTQTNEEAILLASLLREEGYPASLISEKQGFSLRDLLEISTFTHYLHKGIHDDFGLVTEEQWTANKTKLYELYATSQNLDLVDRILYAFEQVIPKKFLSNWKSYLKQIRIEDFYHPEQDKILVSTMHKSKGKEFDYVFLLLDKYPLHTEEKKRVLYVAMTRAKDHLYLHTNNVIFPKDNIAALSYKEDNAAYPAPDTLILQCGKKNVQLGFFKSDEVIYYLKQLKSGDALFPSTADPFIFEDAHGNQVLKFSKEFGKAFQKYLSKGYQVKSAVAKYIVLWYDEESGGVYRVVLGEVVLGR
ncbi:MAG: ATP-dependent DNA helicase RecQ [Nitrospinales bacterium]